jgi:hypothetical protein
VLTFTATGTPTQQITLLSFRFSEGLSPLNPSSPRWPISPAHPHFR